MNLAFLTSHLCGFPFLGIRQAAFDTRDQWIPLKGNQSGADLQRWTYKVEWTHNDTCPLSPLFLVCPLTTMPLANQSVVNEQVH
jgi:hypothetical protein